MQERLHKYLARCGVASRRTCEDLILAGRVKVNHQTIQRVGIQIDPQKDFVEVDGVPVMPRPHVYLILNKPKGYITSVKRKDKNPTVMELLTGVKERVYPVGRLDLDSEGLLLCTNDGELAFRLMHPRYHVEKRYLVRISGTPAEEDLRYLEAGIQIGKERLSAVHIRITKTQKRETELEVILKEGRKRQIRRMFQSIGHPVTSLVRVAIGDITVTGLAQGCYRHLTTEEVHSLKKVVGLSSNPKLF